MENLTKAYVWSIILTLLTLVSAYLISLFSSRWFLMAMTTITLPIPAGALSTIATVLTFAIPVVHIMVVGNLLAQDAISRQRSKTHQLWAFLGIVGVIIYHKLFTKGPVQQQPGQQQPPQQQPPAQPPPQQYQQPPPQQPAQQQPPAQPPPQQYQQPPPQQPRR